MGTQLILPFIAGLVVAYVAFWNAERKITIDNITKERAKWRDKIRELALEIYKAIVAGDEPKLSELKNQFRLYLNPTDDEDKNILHLICANKKDKEKRAKQFSVCVSHLLKHDWERAKLESKPLCKRLVFLHSEKSETTDSPKRIVKFLYMVLYHPKRSSCSDEKSKQ